MNSMHYPTSRETTTATMRPLSPNDHPRYHGNHAPFVSPRPHQHPRPTQSSCPVHGHESGAGGGHQHGGDERRGGGGAERPPGIPFEGPTHVQREFHSHHAQHPRMREEMQFIHGRPHPLEVRTVYGLNFSSWYRKYIKPGCLSNNIWWRPTVHTSSFDVGLITLFGILTTFLQPLSKRPKRP